MKNLIRLLLSTAFLLSPLAAKAQYLPFPPGISCTSGAGKVVTSGLQSTNNALLEFPSCTVTIYNHGTLTLSTLYSNSTGTSLGNPFTAPANGLPTIYAAAGAYDVQVSSTGMPTYTFSNVIISSSNTRVLYANNFPGSDIFAQANAALFSCGMVNGIPGGCEVHIPVAANFLNYPNVTTTLNLAGTNIPGEFNYLKVVFDGGACINYTGSGNAIIGTSPAVPNVNFELVNPCIVGTSASTGGLYIPHYEQIIVRNPVISGFSKSGAFGLDCDGNDHVTIDFGDIYSNYDNLVINNCNGVNVNNTHFTGAIHRNWSIPASGSYVSFNGTVNDPQSATAEEGLGYINSGVGIVINGGYCGEGGPTSGTYGNYGLVVNGGQVIVKNCTFQFTGLIADIDVLNSEYLGMFMNNDGSANDTYSVDLNNFIGNPPLTSIISAFNENWTVNRGTSGIKDVEQFNARFGPTYSSYLGYMSLDNEAPTGAYVINGIESLDLTIGGGVHITNTSSLPQVGTPTISHSTCVKSAGPPVVIGYCSTVVASDGTCTCN